MRRRLQHAGVSVAIDAVLKCDVGADATKFRKHMAYVDDAFTAFHNYTMIDLDFPPPSNLLDMARCMVAGSTKLRELGAELLERPVFVQHAYASADKRPSQETQLPGARTLASRHVRHAVLQHQTRRHGSRVVPTDGGRNGYARVSMLSCSNKTQSSTFDVLIMTCHNGAGDVQCCKA